MNGTKKQRKMKKDGYKRRFIPVFYLETSLPQYRAEGTILLISFADLFLSYRAVILQFEKGKTALYQNKILFGGRLLKGMHIRIPKSNKNISKKLLTF